MFKNMKNIAGMLKNAQALQKNMEEAKAKITSTVFNASHGGVELAMGGNYQILDINPGNVTDIKELIEAIKACHSDCIAQIAKVSEEQITNLSKDFNMDDLLGSDDK